MHVIPEKDQFRWGEVIRGAILISFFEDGVTTLMTGLCLITMVKRLFFGVTR